MLLAIILIIIIVALLGGFGSRSYGNAAWSPLLIILVVLLILWALGVLRI